MEQSLPRWTPTGACVIAAFFVLSLLAAPAAAEERSDTVKLDPGQHAAIEVPFEDGSALRVRYDVQVTEGPNIDVFVLDNANYQKYTDDEDFQSHGASDMDTGNSEQSFTLTEKGTWRIVLDHTSKGGAQPATIGAESATVAWTVETNLDVEESIRGLPGPATGALLAAVAGAALVLGWRGRRRD